jgi:diacylglycerol kinase (ATP)
MNDVQNNLNLRDRIKSFAFAFHGLVRLVRYEHNAWIHTLAAICAVGLGIWCRLSAVEWGLVLICIGLVLSLEAVNTAIEKLVDLVSPQHNREAGNIKDLSAAAVLIGSIIALGVGMIIFIPHLLRIFKITG